MINVLSSPWIGHLYLDFGPDAALTASAPSPDPLDPGCVRLDLAPFQKQWPAWREIGGRLALQAIAPLAALPKTERSELRFLVAGKGADLCALAGKAIGCQLVSQLEEADHGQTYHRVFWGCGATIPEHHQIKTLLNHLRQEGQLVLFGLPADQVSKVHRALTKQGFALRASGREAGLAFLSGSIEDPHAYRDQPGPLA